MMLTKCPPFIVLVVRNLTGGRAPAASSSVSEFSKVGVTSDSFPSKSACCTSQCGFQRPCRIPLSPPDSRRPFQTFGDEVIELDPILTSVSQHTIFEGDARHLRERAIIEIVKFNAWTRKYGN